MFTIYCTYVDIDGSTIGAIYISFLLSLNSERAEGPALPIPDTWYLGMDSKQPVAPRRFIPNLGREPEEPMIFIQSTLWDAGKSVVVRLIINRLQIVNHQTPRIRPYTRVFLYLTD